ncbi:mutator type transposase [Tanacetum coccineum]
MGVSEWHLCAYEDEIDEELAYINDPNLFSIKIHHGGYFTNPPNREYKKGTFNYFDMVDVDLFSVIDLNDMLCQLGYGKKDIMHYHYKILNNSLNYGLLALASDVDVRSMIKYIGKLKRIEVYVQHGQGSDMGQGNDIDQVNDMEQGSDSDEEQGSKEDDSEEDDSDEEDSDYIDDEDHMMNEVGPSNENVYENKVENFKHRINLDDFESASDSENDGKRKKALRKLKREHEANRSVDPNSCESFYVVRQFTDKKSIKSMVYSVSVATRRQLYIRKNDKHRIRVVCRGKTPTFTYPTINGPSGSSPSKLKNVGGKWVKEKGLTVNGPSPSKLKNVGGKWVKEKGATVNGPSPSKLKNVGGKWVKEKGASGSSNVVCHISKLLKEETWKVKTFDDVHNCLQNRKVNMLTNSFLSKEIEETIVINPDVPVRALQDQFKRKYQLNIFVSKIYRAKEKATLKVKGDYRDQYALLRDYALELQRTNHDTTVKIDIERCCDLAVPERQFKRIYVCIVALKKGFKAGLKDLLGLDGCFMKGSFPGQLLSAIGVDLNHGTYPLTYALVKAETISSWTWFMTCLRDDLELSRKSNFTFISDRQKCATSTTVLYFDKAMDELRRRVNEKAYDYLKKIPPQHWSRAYFSGRPYCDVFLNNIWEVFNRQVQWNGRHQYGVTGPSGDQVVVDVHERTCSCRKWELTGMHCKHALASIWNMATNSIDVWTPKSWVHPTYWLVTWQCQTNV